MKACLFHFFKNSRVCRMNRKDEELFIPTLTLILFVSLVNLLLRFSSSVCDLQNIRYLQPL